MAKQPNTAQSKNAGNTQQMAKAGNMTPIEQIASQIGRMENHFKQALPEDVSVDRFTRVVMTAIQQDPELLHPEVNKQSLYNSCVRAAQDGLLPDGKEGKLVIFNVNTAPKGQTPKWEKRVQWMPMVYGLNKRMTKCGIEIESASVVYEKEKFTYVLGDNPKIEHEPLITGDRGKKLGAYVVIKQADGSKKRLFLRLDELEQIRAASKNGDSGPWKDWEDEMYIKSVLRRMYKRLPIDDSTRWGKAAASAITSDDSLYSFEDIPSQHQGSPIGQTGQRSESMQNVVDTAKKGTTIDQPAQTGQADNKAAENVGNQGQGQNGGQQTQGGARTDIFDNE